MLAKNRRHAESSVCMWCLEKGKAGHECEVKEGILDREKIDPVLRVLEPDDFKEYIEHRDKVLKRADEFQKTHTHTAGLATEKEAAATAEAHLTESMQKTLKVIMDNPGLTYEEIEERGGSQQRVSDLFQAGVVEPVPHRKGKTRRGSPASVWRVVK